MKGDKVRITKPVRGWCSKAHIKERNPAGGDKRSLAVPRIEVEDRCVLIDGRVGTIRYTGTTSFAKGNWFGVALDKPEGKHNGMVKGKRYFDCPPQHGVFVRMNKIAKVKSAKKSSVNKGVGIVNVRAPDGTRHTIRTAPNDDLTNLKYKIQLATKIAPNAMQLSFNGQELSDSASIAPLLNNSTPVVVATKGANAASNAGNNQTASATPAPSAGVNGGATRGKTGSTASKNNANRERWYGCWFFEGEESYVDLSLNVGQKRLTGEAVDEDNDNLVVNGTVKQDDQGHPKWTFKMTMKGEPTIINVGVLINGRIKGVWKVLDSWGKFEMCPAKNLVGKDGKKASRAKDNRIV